jgi:tetratricopeptide repeat protein
MSDAVEQTVERTQRTFIKLFLIALGAVIFLASTIWGGRDLYVRWQEKRLVRRATAELQRGNDREASLAARTILEMNASSSAAARIMAQLAERRGERSALDWRRKVAQEEPQSVPDALALARCALHFNDLATARQTLDAVDKNGRNTAEFHGARAVLAQKMKEDEKAEEEWSEAIRLAPQDSSYRLQLATLRLRSKEPERRKSGEEMLNELRADPTQRVPATRALIMNGAAQHIGNDVMLTMAQELQAYPEATFNDRILYLDILRQLRSPEFTKWLTSFEQDADSDPVKLTALISWMATNGQGLLAIDFVRSLPPEALAKWPVPIAVAEAYATLRDWAALETWVTNKDWGQSDFMRHAYLALALRNQDKTEAADKEWAAAEKQAATQPMFLSMLTRATSEWRWKKEWLELLWTLTKYPETQFEALQNLYQNYSDDRDTSGLYRVLVRLAELMPEDEAIQNNLAQVCLLLNADMEHARKLAAEIYRKQGSTPAYAATYAFALYTNGDITGALKIMSQLSPTQLREPAVAAYYGIFLTAAGDSQNARDYLKLGSTAQLLPEEKTLLTKAANSVK